MRCTTIFMALFTAIQLSLSVDLYKGEAGREGARGFAKLLRRKLGVVGVGRGCHGLGRRSVRMPGADVPRTGTGFRVWTTLVRSALGASNQGLESSIRWQIAERRLACTERFCSTDAGFTWRAVIRVRYSNGEITICNILQGLLSFTGFYLSK